jgi:hypothetical protein
MKWSGHVVIMEAMINAYRMFVRSLKRRDHISDLGVKGRIVRILK